VVFIKLSLQWQPPRQNKSLHFAINKFNKWGSVSWCQYKKLSFLCHWCSDKNATCAASLGAMTTHCCYSAKRGMVGTMFSTSLAILALLAQNMVECWYLNSNVRPYFARELSTKKKVLQHWHQEWTKWLNLASLVSVSTFNWYIFLILQELPSVLIIYGQSLRLQQHWPNI